MPAVTFLYSITGHGLGSMAHGPSKGIMTVTQRRQQGQKKEDRKVDI